MTKKTKSQHRGVSVRLKTARGRTVSSQRWLQRQLNDPYVQEAHKKGYRSRAAFKLIELQEKYHFLKPNMTVVDLGAAPGGWSQILTELVPKGTFIALDLQPMDPIPGVQILEGDFTEEDCFESLMNLTRQGIDVVLSDMAPYTMGHQQTDHLRIMALVEMAYDFAIKVLNPEGVFVAKVLQGGTENQLLAHMKQHFKKVAHYKPPASRKDSSEMYVVATGFLKSQ